MKGYKKVRIKIIYCIMCNKYRKYKKPKIHIFGKTMLSNTCDKGGSNQLTT